MEAFRGGLDRVPLDSPRSAQLADVLAFLHAQVDDEKLGDLMWGLVAVNWSEVARRGPERTTDTAIPVEFGLPRLLVRPLAVAPRGERWGPAAGESAHATKHDPDVLHELAVGRGAAVDRAARRLRAGGLPVNGH